MSKDMIKEACWILDCICHNLDLAATANDPYPIDRDYLEYMLEDTEGLVHLDGLRGWVYVNPSEEQAKNIVRSHLADFLG